MNPFKEVGTVKQRNENILSNKGAPVIKIVFITSILESQLFLSKTVVNSVKLTSTRSYTKDKVLKFPNN